MTVPLFRHILAGAAIPPRRTRTFLAPHWTRGRCASYIPGMSGKTLYDKIWDAHVVATDGEEAILYIDLHLIHEVTTPQAFAGLRAAGRKVRRPDRTLAVADHNTPTEGQALGVCAWRLCFAWPSLRAGTYFSQRACGRLSPAAGQAGGPRPAVLRASPGRG